jgi:predicted nucleic acid-binding protein
MIVLDASDRVQLGWESDGAAMCSVNLGEALYAEIRDSGREAAKQAIAAVRRQMTLVDPDWELVAAAAEIKSRGGLSYADAFCVATAQQLDAPLWTGDPEIVGLSGEVEIVDLRS